MITLSILTTFLAMNWWNTNTQPVSDSTEIKRFVVVRGASAESVANNLYDQGLIRSSLAFKFYLQLIGQAGSILPGEYNLSPSMTIQDISEKIRSRPDEFWVTIREGLRREQIPAIFINSLGMTGNEAKTFSQEFLEASKDLEGFLFPETYLFPPDVNGAQAVFRLKNTFDQKTANLSEEIARSDYSIDQIVTLASLIEREAITDDERFVIAGILFNRMEIGMPLQIDATVQYARANAICNELSDCNWWEPVLVGDLNYYVSPYNTYTSNGIPPAPIANPGLKSIEAILRPVESNYLFYLHDRQGNIHYAENVQQHNINKANYINN